MNLFSTIQALLDDSDLIKNEKKSDQNQSHPQKTFSKPYNKTYSKTYTSEGKPQYDRYGKNDETKEKIKKPAASCYGLYPIDGDTFVGMYEKQKMNFRLAGIDAPEKNENWAKESKQFLRQYIDKKVVFLEFKGKDKYDRHIVEVFVDKEKTQSINKMLVANGLATSESYKNSEGEKTHGIIENALNEATEWKAKLTNKGMWSK